MINRAQLRGKPLDTDCKMAQTSRYEYGPEDDRVFCLGLQNCMDDAYLEKCNTCGAFICNAWPPEEVK